MVEELRLARVSGPDVHASINMRRDVVATQADPHAVLEKPEVDSPHTMEEEFQLEMYRALAGPITPQVDNLRGLYARYDVHAQARATGVEPQTWEFDGVMSTDGEVSNDFYEAHRDDRPAVEIVILEA